MNQIEAKLSVVNSDQKGRVSTGTSGQRYTRTEFPDGTITLTPLNIPKLPDPRQISEVPAVYAEMSAVGTGVVTTVYPRQENGMYAIAHDAAGFARSLQVPLFVETSGSGIGLLAMARDEAGDFDQVFGVNRASRDYQEAHGAQAHRGPAVRAIGDHLK